MNDLVVVYWRDIPAQVISGQGRRATRAMMPERFQDAIDRAATRAGLIGSDEYMAEWRKVPTDPGDPQEVADELATTHPPTILEGLIRNYGKTPA